jgi:hypothetical protein
MNVTIFSDGWVQIVKSDGDVIDFDKSKLITPMTGDDLLALLQEAARNGIQIDKREES